MKLQKIFIPIITILVFFSLANKASAATTMDCSVYKSNASVFDAAVNQQRFATDMFTSLVLGPLTMTITGSDFAKSCECANLMIEKDIKNAKEYDAIKENDACKPVNTYLGSGGLFITSKLAFEMLDSASELISPKYYAQSIIHKSFLGKSANAAISDMAMEAILDTWEAMRNVSYTLFVAVFVILGFMIMFRKRIDPQTVVTLQNSLPRIILSLILITFSYPLISLIFTLSTPISDYIKVLFGNPDIALSIIVSLLTILIGVGSAVVLGPLGIAAGILFIAAGFALFFAFIYLGIVIITRLTKLVILTVASPFILLMGALPGNEKTILNLFKNVFSLAMQIPAIWFILYLSLKLMQNVMTMPSSAASIPAGMVKTLLGITLLYSVGKVPKAIDNALGVEPVMFGDSGPKKGKK